MANLVGRGGLCVPYELEKTVVAAPEIAGVFLFRRDVPSGDSGRGYPNL